MKWLHSLLKELGKGLKNVKIFSYNQSAIRLVKNSAFHARTKHIDIKYHFTRSFLKKDVFTLENIHISQNPADMLTKAVTREKLSTCSVSVGIQE